MLARAGQQTPAEFRRAVRTVAARLDGRREAEQHEAAASERRVCYQPDEHAMAWVNAYLPAADAQTVMTAVQAVADKNRHTDPDHRSVDHRSADQRRADALTSICAAILTGSVPDGSARWQGRRPAVQVSVALSTLTGADDQPGQLDGFGPIPAGYARRIAADPTGTWRRLVTDPVGALVDYGRSSYRPPADLRDHVIARDRACRGVGCHRNARRAELDHVRPWAEGGRTAADNLASECSREQHLKHDAGWTVQLAANGTVTWTSPTGRRYDKPPDTYPIDRTLADDDADPPPFRPVFCPAFGDGTGRGVVAPIGRRRLK